ncbi:hypothetical protein PHIM7_149 [Sinorhizobium phage phiM7]|uniref:Uncharacterized protein n=2 Tax=Emdodecavirus TaxID=1980937 RepID=S5MD40_9CAUD|nr:hypothetical protein AB690_gp348 [Sinorhizobium phage phiM12]YP_009601274.1 hypothetical protein FDH46_gp329 [Sinorhizobium phage phiM7]AGR47849.1 hypothetical protein SmphiM12_217 [Sinorhizobium phage phiM12]AKF12695.1 hypothetical protein PHIM7_149 [Sinorhizobium phage phiM7]AKF13054.1 hypothetical protein PHIM19_149 [Sinorhizobium phage phiM19]
MNALEFEYGLGIVETETGVLLHAALYPKEPTQEDAYVLYNEMMSDEILYSIIEGRDFLIVLLPDTIVQKVKEEWYVGNPGTLH